MTESQDQNIRRYHADPLFHACVHLVSRIFGNGGFRDDDGVFHPGPTVGDLTKTAQFLEALEATGIRLTDRLPVASE